MHNEQQKSLTVEQAKAAILEWATQFTEQAVAKAVRRGYPVAEELELAANYVDDHVLMEEDATTTFIEKVVLRRLKYWGIRPTQLAVCAICMGGNSNPGTCVMICVAAAIQWANRCKDAGSTDALLNYECVRTVLPITHELSEEMLHTFWDRQKSGGMNLLDIIDQPFLQELTS